MLKVHPAKPWKLRERKENSGAEDEERKVRRKGKATRRRRGHMTRYILQRRPGGSANNFFPASFLIIRNIQTRYAIVINISREWHHNRAGLSGGNFASCDFKGPSQGDRVGLLQSRYSIVSRWIERVSRCVGDCTSPASHLPKLSWQIVQPSIAITPYYRHSAALLSLLFANA